MNFGTYGFPQGLGLNDGLFGLPSYKILWTPANTTTALWLDAADNATITTVLSAVTQWDDKSGNSRNVSPTSTDRRPLKGTNTISFDGVDDFLVTGSAFPALNDFSVFAVVDGNNIPTNQERGIVAIDNGTSSGSVTGYWFERTSFAGAGLATYVNNANIFFNSLPATSFSPKIVGQTRQKDVSCSLFADGTLGITATTGNTVTGTVSSNLLYIGRSFLTYSGNIYEVIILNVSANIDIRQRIEGYLSHKWGLTANLPVDHPYKILPPTT